MNTSTSEHFCFRLEPELNPLEMLVMLVNPEPFSMRDAVGVGEVDVRDKMRKAKDV